MKHLLSYSIVVILLFTTNLIAQNTYSVDGNTVELQTEVDGPLSLLWNITDGNYNYYVMKGNTITELKNTKVDKEYQEEYKIELQKQVSDAPMAVDKVKFTLASLRNFISDYNKRIDPNFVEKGNNIKLKTRLGAFVGITNYVYSANPNNKMLPTMGADFEIVDHNLLKRHSLVLRFKQIFENSEYKFSSSQFSLNYRFKFIKKEKLDVFLNTKIAGYHYESRQVEVINEDGSTDLTTVSDGNFEALLNFGIGADYALGNGYLTFMYNDFISVVQESNSVFPLDFSLGYKFNL
jgi:hypothetical protein